MLKCDSCANVAIVLTGKFLFNLDKCLSLISLAIILIKYAYILI